jgi:hypothetical protein
MKNKVKTMQEAYRVFELLGIKDVTKPWQKAKGTEVWELPFKTMYYNGSAEINRFTIYKNGYVRKMVVYGENNASKSCYQLNRVRKVASFIKDYKWNYDTEESEWTGKYRKVYNNERIMIDNHRDRVVYLCNYILKNYYRNNKCALVGEYTMKRVAEVHGEWWRNERKHDQLPFETIQSEDSKHGISPNHSVQVIINGHRYNLS